MEQAIVRTVPGSGYDIANSTPDWPPDLDIFVLLPHVTIRDPHVSPHFRYFSKAWFSSPLEGYLVKLVVPENDEFGRTVLKAHCLWLTKEEYLSNGLPSYISPLLENKIIPGANTLLENHDFRVFPIYLTAQKILEDVLLKPVVSVAGNLYLQDAIARQFSFIDYALPDEFNAQLKIHSFLKEEDQELRGKYNLSFCLRKQDSSASLDWLKAPSSLEIVQQISKSLANPLERKRIHQKLIRGEFKEKRFYLRMCKRFGVK
ncbi:MAG: hypothetical protein ACFFGZ_02000 [Candidatus Thorarchaeota archaeon]